MIVNTRRLFTRLLRDMRITAVADVGSMNGADALAFRNAVPDATIFALEPNPHNFRLMNATRLLRERDIQVEPLAVSNYDGVADFFLVEAEYSRTDFRRGMSSLYVRSNPGTSPAAVVRVETTRLDTYLADKCPPWARIALWIDVEGKAHEAIEGVSSISRRVYLLHVEVEASPCINADQKLYPEVKALLRRLGFVEFATDLGHAADQFNAVYVRHDLPAGMRLRVNASLLRARVRRVVGGWVAKLCPVCLRYYQVVRRGTSDTSIS